MLILPHIQKASSHPVFQGREEARGTTLVDHIECIYTHVIHSNALTEATGIIYFLIYLAYTRARFCFQRCSSEGNHHAFVYCSFSLWSNSLENKLRIMLSSSMLFDIQLLSLSIYHHKNAMPPNMYALHTFHFMRTTRCMN